MPRLWVFRYLLGVIMPAPTVQDVRLHAYLARVSRPLSANVTLKPAFGQV
jgi:hypothetical protein